MSIDSKNEHQTTENLEEDFATLLESHSLDAPSVSAGQKIRCKVIAISGENVFLDVGIKVDGIMEYQELIGPDGEPMAGVGDSVEAWVISASAHEVRLSRSMSGGGVAALEDARDAGIPVDGKITALCKGGYTVEVLGKRAFCPGSQIGFFTSENSEELIGKTTQFLITRIESNGRNIIVSRRILIERDRQESIDKLLSELKEGDTVEGQITRLAPFGAFMEIAPSVEGMIHISELSWSRVGNADEVVSPGDLIRAKVLSMGKDPKGQIRISLSRKQAEGDPWESVSDRLNVGDVMQGRVVRLTPFGAFIEILPGVDGLVHVSEMSWTKRVNKPEEVLAVGDDVAVKIKELSIENRRISLSMRDAEGDPWAQVAEKFAVGSIVEGTVESQAKFGFFINLAPGITGLLPHAVIKNTENAKELSALEKGQSVKLMVQNVDKDARRIGLAPEGAEAGEDNSWKEHAAPASSSSGLGSLGQALANAMNKNK